MSVDPIHAKNIHQDFLFHSLTRAHFNAQMTGLKSRGLLNLGSPRILFVLMDLSERNQPAPSQKELADMLHISPATAATSLKSLERSGYVSRHIDERDSRRNRISITEAGLCALRTSREVFESVDEYMFHGFTQAERDMLYAFHRRMLDNLYQIGGDQDFEGPPPPPPPERMV